MLKFCDQIKKQDANIHGFNNINTLIKMNMDYALFRQEQNIGRKQNFTTSKSRRDDMKSHYVPTARYVRRKRGNWIKCGKIMFQVTPNQ